MYNRKAHHYAQKRLETLTDPEKQQKQTIKTAAKNVKYQRQAQFFNDYARVFENFKPENTLKAITYLVDHLKLYDKILPEKTSAIKKYFAEYHVNNVIKKIAGQSFPNMPQIPYLHMMTKELTIDFLEDNYHSLAEFFVNNRPEGLADDYEIKLITKLFKIKNHDLSLFDLLYTLWMIQQMQTPNIDAFYTVLARTYSQRLTDGVLYDVFEKYTNNNQLSIYLTAFFDRLFFLLSYFAPEEILKNFYEYDITAFEQFLLDAPEIPNDHQRYIFFGVCVKEMLDNENFQSQFYTNWINTFNQE